MHDVRFFLNLCVYYRKSIKNFIIITKSFYEFIQKIEDRKYKSILIIFLTRNAFIVLKIVMCNDRVLTSTQFDIFLSFIIKTNVSNFD